MGYRSEVRSCIYSDNHELFDSFIASRKLTDDVVFGEGDDSFVENLEYTKMEYKNTDGEVIQTIKILAMKGDDWKWYPEYDYVKAWEKLLSDAEDAGLNYEFCRVGEEDGDIEYDTGGSEVEHFIDTYTHINVAYGD